MSLLSEAIIYLASDVHTAKDAWKAIEDHGHLRNSSRLDHKVLSFFSTKMQHNDVLTDHHSSYKQKYIYTTEHTGSANDQAPYRYLLEYLKCDEAKERHHLISLTSWIDNIVDNLKLQDSLTYSGVRSRLLELSGSSNLSSDGKALNTCTHEVNNYNNEKKNCEKPYTTGPGKTEPHGGNKCSHCKKHGHEYDGYTDNFRNQLLFAHEGSSSSASPPASASDVVPSRANLTVNEPYDDGTALVTSSLAHPVLTILSGSALKTANDETYKL